MQARDQRGNALQPGHVVELTCEQPLVCHALAKGRRFVVLAAVGVDRVTLGDPHSRVPAAFGVHSRRLVYVENDDLLAIDGDRAGDAA